MENRRALGNRTQCRRTRRRCTRTTRAPRAADRCIVGVGRTLRRRRADRYRRVGPAQGARDAVSRRVTARPRWQSVCRRDRPWPRWQLAPPRDRAGARAAFDFAASVYLVLFGVGTVATMATFSSLVGGIASHRRASAAVTQSALLATCAACAIAVGTFWLVSDLA